MVIVVETEDDAVMGTVLAEAESFLADLSVKKTVSGAPSEASSWGEAVAMLPNANMALFSIPGEYAAPELERALDLGLNVFSFTDNVALEDEVRLKQKAHMAEVIDELNAVKPGVGFDKVYWPGERAQMRIQATKDAGGIEIVDSIYEYLKSDELYIHSWDHKNRFAE